MPSEAVRTTCAQPSPVERDLGVTICPPAPLHPHGALTHTVEGGSSTQTA